jgi:hypothetical protein
MPPHRSRVSPQGPPAPPFVRLELTPAERAQIEEQLAACFGLTSAAARTWVETTAGRGACYGRVVGGQVAASFAAETLPLARGTERLTAVMLQSCYVHPDFRGRGFGLERADVDELRHRFAADAVVLTLFDDGLVPYWRRRGFDVVQRAEVVDLDEHLRRTGTAFGPALTQDALAAKLVEVTADGALLCEAGGLVLVRYPGGEVVDELIVREPGWASPSPRQDIHVRLKTVMASPGDLELVCAIDL